MVGGGILAYQYWWLLKQETKMPEIAIKDKTTEKIISTFKEQTADWQTYRNEEYGFEVRYPEGIIKEFASWETSENNFRAIVQLNFQECYIAFGGIPIGFPDLPPDIEVKTDEITLLNKKVERTAFIHSGTEKGFAAFELDYPKDPTYPYFLIYHSADAQCSNLVDQILSIFKFIE